MQQRGATNRTRICATSGALLPMEDSRRYENRLVLILFFTWGTGFLDRMSQLYLTPYFAPKFHLSIQQIGFQASVVSVSWGLSCLLFGALTGPVCRHIVVIPR